MEEKHKRLRIFNNGYLALALVSLFLAVPVAPVVEVKDANNEERHIAQVPISTPSPTQEPTPTPTPAPQPATESETIIIVETIVVEPSPVPTVLVAGESARVEERSLSEIIRNPAGKVYGYIKNDKKK